MEAMKNGVVFGRKRSIDRVKLMELSKSMGAKNIAIELGIAISTVYKIIKEESQIKKDT